ncbi:MAG: tripartite tricarboxylate transporter TctB family protein [Bacillota bacterium]|nr:tripartite tricarboxylate transporter TctB family protein [Bacillota bacterium]
MAEKIMTGLFFLFGLLWFTMSFNLASSNFGGGLGLGPDFFPRLLSILMMIFSLIQLVRTFRKDKKEALKLNIHGLSVIMIISCITYLFAIGIIGYLVSTFLFLTIVIYVLSGKKSIKDTAIALGISLALYGIFHLVLKVPLPTGFLI